MTYVLAYTPRSGSWLLAEALAGTGVAGKPRELFRPEWWGKAPGPDLLVKAGWILQQCGTPNGTTGVKAHWLDWQGTAARADVPPAGLHALLGRPVYVLSTRRDKVRQAVSYAIATKTKQWFRFADTPAKDPGPFDRAAVERAKTQVAGYEASWRAYLAAVNADVMEVVYEDLAAAYDPTVRAVLARIGVPADGVRVPAPRLVQQADARTEEWVAAAAA